MSPDQRREFHEALLDADVLDDLPGKWQAAIVGAEQKSAQGPDRRRLGRRGHRTGSRFTGPVAGRGERRRVNCPAASCPAGCKRDGWACPRKVLHGSLTRRPLLDLAHPEIECQPLKLTGDGVYKGYEGIRKWIESRVIEVPCLQVRVERVEPLSGERAAAFGRVLIDGRDVLVLCACDDRARRQGRDDALVPERQANDGAARTALVRPPSPWLRRWQIRGNYGGAL
jgi:hypothetical protein